MNRLTRITRIELVLILILIGLGFTLRVWKIASVGLDHYDEGVYVFSAWGMADRNPSTGLFPDQYKFSPPGYFGLLGLIDFLSDRPADTAAFVINVIFGTLSILAIWLVARNWFGPAAGIFSASLLAFNEYHIQLSRTALTDVGFAFFFIIAMGLLANLVQTRKLRDAIFAGLVVGIAWNFKYHGWFAVFIASLALIPYLWFTRREIKDFPRLLGLWVVASFVAILLFVPWALYVQSQPGGYPGLLSYQSTLIDWHGYLHKLWLQVQQQRFYEGPLSFASLPLGFVAAFMVSERKRITQAQLIVLLLGLSGAAILVGASGVAALLSLVSIIWLLKQPASYPAWLLYGWIGFWTVMTPLYFPYARLVLPFTIATFIGSGFFISKVLSGSEKVTIATSRQVVLAGSIASAVVLAAGLFLPHPSNPWRASRSMAVAASEMLNMIPVGSRVVVIGEPSLAYYLDISGRPAFGRFDNPDEWIHFKDPVYFVTGVYTKRAPDLSAGLEQIKDRLNFLRQFEVYPKDLRVMDDFNPASARKFLLNPDDTFNLSLYYLNGSTEY